MNDSPHLSEDKLHAYLDAELAPGERRAAERHLAGCPGCAARVAELRALWQGLAAFEEPPLGRDLAPAVLAAIRQPSARARSRFGKPRAVRALWLAQAVAAALLVIAFWLAEGAAPAPGARWIPEQLTEAIGGLATLQSGAALLPAGASMRLPELGLGQVGAGLPLPALLTGLAALAGCWALANALLLRPLAGGRSERRMGHG
ncbi:MAG TPA: zf-HC2 domain-containing protein [Herpetosiphonaceae bacterium]